RKGYSSMSKTTSSSSSQSRRKDSPEEREDRRNNPTTRTDYSAFFKDPNFVKGISNLITQIRPSTSQAPKTPAKKDLTNTLKGKEANVCEETTRSPGSTKKKSTTRTGNEQTDESRSVTDTRTRNTTRSVFRRLGKNMADDDLRRTLTRRRTTQAEEDEMKSLRRRIAELEARRSAQKRLVSTGQDLTEVPLKRATTTSRARTDQEQRGETSASGGRKRTVSRRDEEHSVHIPIRRSGPPTRVNTSRESSSVSRRQVKPYVQKAYSTGHQVSRAEVNRHIPMPTNLIMFSDKDSLPFDNPHSDALVITAPIFRIPVHRIMVDTGAYSSILYWTAFLKMGIDQSELRPCNDHITGFNGQATIPEGEITLPIELGGSGANGRRIMETFKVVKTASEYNAILGRTALYKLKAAVSIFHYSIKFPTENGTGVHYGNQREVRECIMAIPSLEIHSVMMANEEEKLIVESVVEPEQSDEQEVSSERSDNSAAKGYTNEQKRMSEEPIEGPEEEDKYPMLTSSNANTPSPPRDGQGKKAVKESEADQTDPKGEQNQ
ncbi:Unknown protein, partial [Striga hermonthica]